VAEQSGYSGLRLTTKSTF